MGQGLGTNNGLHIGMAVGLTLATCIWITADVSGAHLNPAVTLATLVTRRISFVKFVFYLLVQIIGAIIGVAILKGVSPNAMNDNMACTLISDKISVGQGFAIEMIITFVLVMTVFAACDGARQDLKGSAALAIGIAVFVGHLFAVSIPYNENSLFPPNFVLSFFPFLPTIIQHVSNNATFPDAEVHQIAAAVSPTKHVGFFQPL